MINDNQKKSLLVAADALMCKELLSKTIIHLVHCMETGDYPSQCASCHHPVDECNYMCGTAKLFSELLSILGKPTIKKMFDSDDDYWSDRLLSEFMDKANVYDRDINRSEMRNIGAHAHLKIVGDHAHLSHPLSAKIMSRAAKIMSRGAKIKEEE